MATVMMIDIPCRRYGKAELVIRADPGQGKAARAVQRGSIQREICARRSAIDDIGLAGPREPIIFTLYSANRLGPDDQIIITVAI